MLKKFHFHSILLIILLSFTGFQAFGLACSELMHSEKEFLINHFHVQYGKAKHVKDSDKAFAAFWINTRRKAFNTLLGEELSKRKDADNLFSTFTDKIFMNKDCSFIKTILQKEYVHSLEALKKKKATQCQIKTLKKYRKKITVKWGTEYYLNSFAQALDPHSGYHNSEQTQKIMDSMDGTSGIEGIGIGLGYENCHYVALSIQPNSPAEKGGLQKGDILLEVATKGNNDFQGLSDLEIGKAIGLIKGPRYSPVKLKVKRVSSSNPKDTKIVELHLIRDKVFQFENKIRYEFKKIRKNGKHKRIGIIHFPSFNRLASAQMAEAIEKAQEQGAEALVLNLQNNPGGSLDETLSITGMFLESANLLRQLSIERLAATTAQTTLPKYKGPLVVLTNRMSASASEIVSGVLKDYGRALIVGDKSTYGKGSVQTFRPRFIGDAFRVTVDLYFLPSGNTPQGQGVSSDIVLPTIIDPKEVGEENIENFIKPLQIQSFKSTDSEAGFQSGYQKVTPELITQLQNLSLKRVQGYQALEEAIKADDSEAWGELRVQEAINIATDMAILNEEGKGFHNPYSAASTPWKF